MTYTYPIMPDEVKVAINFLRTHPLIVAFGSVTISGDEIGYNFPARWVKIESTGGAEVNDMRLIAPRIDANCRAEDKPTAKALARTVAAVLKSMKDHKTAEAVVTKVTVSTPYDLTDPVNNSPRFVVDATIYIRNV